MDMHGHWNADSPEAARVADTSSTAASVAATDTPSVTAADGGSSFPATQRTGRPSSNPVAAAPPTTVLSRIGRGMIQFSVTWGGNFMAHTIIIDAGEDIVLKILSFFGEEHVALMVYNATGTVSEATIYEPAVQGFLTIRDEFTILSLIAIFRRCESRSMQGNPNSNPEPDRLRGNLMVSLRGSDGTILVDKLIRSLIAASPIQVVIGIFMPRAYQAPPPHQNNNSNDISSTAVAPTHTRSRTNPFDHLPHFNGPASSSSSR